MTNQTNLNPGSFRDPAGQVFTIDGKVYRSIFKLGVDDYQAARDAGIFDKLFKKGYMLPHKELDSCDFAPNGTVHCLEHEKLPFVSYPWEWPFSMLKDAALLHLDAMEELIKDGFWLRDATAFNAQFDGNRLRLIDTLSVGVREPDSPWVGYKQFCSHFLAPLSMAAYCDVRMMSLWRNYIDGIPLDLAKKTIPALKRYKPGLFMHLTLHANLQSSADKRKDIGEKKNSRKPKVSDIALTGLIRSLRKTVSGIAWKRTSKIWEEYQGLRTYKDKDVIEKSEYVDKVVERVQPKMVWDLGGNTGEFSIISASKGAFVVSVDGDPACTEYLYQRISKEKIGNKILPLTMDLANPSPGLGWDGEKRERPSLSDRGPAGLVLALALIHHLVFSAYIPLKKVAEWFSSLSEHLLVEYVPNSDPMVKKLLLNRGDDHLPYSLEVFKDSFSEYFTFLDEKKLENGRTLFLCKRK
jgi:ribosomal protein L11 methylase PrmA